MVHYFFPFYYVCFLNYVTQLPGQDYHYTVHNNISHITMSS